MTATDKSKRWTLVLFVTSLVVVVLWVAFPFLLPLFKSPWTLEQMNLRGTFGDSYGALNTLFSGLAFAAIVVTLVLQAQELNETRADTKSMVQAQITAAQLSALSTLFQYENYVLDHLKSYKTKNEKMYKELNLHFEKQALLLKEISNVISELPSHDQSNWDQIRKIDTQLDELLEKGDAFVNKA